MPAQIITAEAVRSKGSLAWSTASCPNAIAHSTVPIQPVLKRQLGRLCHAGAGLFLLLTS